MFSDIMFFFIYCNFYLYVIMISKKKNNMKMKKEEEKHNYIGVVYKNVNIFNIFLGLGGKKSKM